MNVSRSFWIASAVAFALVSAPMPSAHAQQSASVGGKLFDALSRQPLAGATVTWEAPGASPATTISDKLGAYQLTVPAGKGELLVDLAGRPRFSSGALLLEAGGRKSFDAWILSAFDCSGTVVDPKGKPVVGAEIAIDIEHALPASLVPTISQYPAFATKRMAAKSGPDGSFKIGPLLNAAGWRLEISSSDAPPISIAVDPGHAVGMRVQLPPAGEIRGKVVALDNRPLAGATVTVSEPLRAAIGALPAATTDANGIFRIRPLAAGSWRVTVEPPRALTELFDRVKLLAGEVKDLGTIRIRPGSTLTGRVVDSRGEPVAKVSIQALRRIGQFTRQMRTATSAADGSFSLEGLSGEEADLQLRPPAPFLEKSLTHQRTDQSALEIELQRGGSIEGEIVASDGTALVRADVRALQLDKDRRERSSEQGKLVWIDQEQGRFRIDALPEGTYRLSAHAAGRTPTVSERLELPAEGRLDSIRLELERGAAVDGVVIDAGSKLGVAGALVSAADLDETATSSDETGRFHLEGLSRGTLRLIASHRLYAPGFTSVTIGERPPEALTIELSKGATLQGRVADRGGAPAPNIGIQVGGEHGKESFRTLTGADGRYRFEHLPPGMTGVSRVGARPADSGERKQVELSEGETSEIDFTIGNLLEGTVTRMGAPAPDVIVQAVTAPNDWDFPHGDAPRVVATGITGADGRYRLEGVGVGKTTISLMHGLQSSTRIVELPDSPTEQRDFQLPTRPLRLHVIDRASGQPLAGAGTNVNYSDGQRSSWMSSTSGRDEQGTWLVQAGGGDEEKAPSIGVGTVEILIDGSRPTNVVAYATDYEADSKQVPPGSSPVELELALSKSIPITLVLSAEGGGAIKEARVCLISEEPSENGSPSHSVGCNSGSGGPFEFGISASSSSNSLTISAAGFVSVTKLLPPVAEIEPRSTIEVALAPAGKLLVSIQGAVAPEIVKIEKEVGVDLYAIAVKSESVTPQSQEGRKGLLIEGLPLGDLTVTYKFGGAERVAPIRIENGKTVELRLN